MVSSCVNPTCCAQLSTSTKEIFTHLKGSLRIRSSSGSVPPVYKIALRLDAMGDVSVRLRSER